MKRDALVLFLAALIAYLVARVRRGPRGFPGPPGRNADGSYGTVNSPRGAEVPGYEWLTQGVRV